MDKSARQIRYYLRLTNLIDVLLNKVDERSISIRVGAEGSFLNVSSQTKEKLYLQTEKFRKYFSKEYTIKQCEDALWKILNKWVDRRNKKSII